MIRPKDSNGKALKGTWESAVYLTTPREMYNYIHGTTKKLTDPDPTPQQIAQV